jgi:hypothetical protein
MFEKFIILFFFTWVLFNYGPPPILIYCYNWFHYIDFKNVFSNIDNILFNKFCYERCLNESDSDSEYDNNKSSIKYENKYLNDIRELNKEWVFTPEEHSKIIELTESNFNTIKENMILRLKKIEQDIFELENEIKDDEDYVEDYNSEIHNKQDEYKYIYEMTVEERNQERRQQIKDLEKEFRQVNNDLKSEEILASIKDDALDSAKRFIINSRLDKMKNSYIIEKTPLGNVLMIYDKERESFKYYADLTIPYRYLEPVARKYVKFFNCRPIFVDMEEELRLFEEKWEKDQQLKKQKEEEKESYVIETKNNNKKNVFAKFKSYNKDAGGKISMAPPKNNIPNRRITENKENEKVLLKERANRYTYEGKFANFNFLQKIERKVFNKKLGLSFAEFKKIHQQNNKNNKNNNNNNNNN